MKQAGTGLRNSALLIPAIGLLLGSCALRAQSFKLSALEPAREARFATAGEWQELDGAMANVIPEGTPSQLLVDSVNGVGVSLGLVKDFVAEDLAITCEASFEANGAPNVLFRVQEEEGVVTAMHSLTLTPVGVQLWRLYNDQWTQLGAYVYEMTPGQRYTLHATAVDDRITVRLDGEKLFVVRDTLLWKPGRIGVCGMSGPCRFYELRAKNLE
ncbi:MAG: hypothetical protein KJ052_11745 [Candidatus Hydrogenedentes bacterium]|nr:hypothetical protein [Candidatus Hydrogenedentota bacterium]